MFIIKKIFEKRDDEKEEVLFRIQRLDGISSLHENCYYYYY
jgi:hypothetical protein